MATWPYDDLETILQSVGSDPSQLYSERRNPVKQCIFATRHVHSMQSASNATCSRNDFAIETL